MEAQTILPAFSYHSNKSVTLRGFILTPFDLTAGLTSVSFSKQSFCCSLKPRGTLFSGTVRAISPLNERLYDFSASLRRHACSFFCLLRQADPSRTAILSIRSNIRVYQNGILRSSSLSLALLFPTSYMPVRHLLEPPDATDPRDDGRSFHSFITPF